MNDIMNKIGKDIFSKINKGTLIIAGAIVAVIIMIIVGISSVHSNAINYYEKVTEAQSAIKVEEKRRADLIPNLVDCVKDYNRHEYETLLAVIDARSQQSGEITDELAQEIKNELRVVVEAYPELKSQTNYDELMKELSTTENMIAEVRKNYNNAVTRYNVYTLHPIRKFFLSITGYERVEFEKLDYNVSEDAPTNLFK